MRVKLIKDWTDEKGRTDKAGTHIDIAYRYAKALIKKGIAIPDTEQVENITSYSKDNPPPEVQEVEPNPSRVLRSLVTPSLFEGVY